MKKQLFALFLITVSIVGLTGCSSNTNQNPDSKTIIGVESMKAVEDSNVDSFIETYPGFDFKKLDRNVDVVFKKGQSSHIIESDSKNIDEVKQWASQYVNLAPVIVGETGQQSNNSWSGVSTFKGKYIFFDLTIHDRTMLRLVLSEG